MSWGVKELRVLGLRLNRGDRDFFNIFYRLILDFQIETLHARGAACAHTLTLSINKIAILILTGETPVCQPPLSQELLAN